MTHAHEKLRRHLEHLLRGAVTEDPSTPLAFTVVFRGAGQVEVELCLNWKDGRRGRRQAILDYLRDQPRPVSHRDILDALSETGNYAHSTLRRDLSRLVGEGMLTSSKCKPWGYALTRSAKAAATKAANAARVS